MIDEYRAQHTRQAPEIRVPQPRERLSAPRCDGARARPAAVRVGKRESIAAAPKQLGVHNFSPNRGPGTIWRLLDCTSDFSALGPSISVARHWRQAMSQVRSIRLT
jgi:hypothetical protein